MKNWLISPNLKLPLVTSVALLIFLLIFLWQCTVDKILPDESPKRPFSVSLNDAVSVAQKFDFGKKDNFDKNARANAINEVDKKETIFDSDQKTALFHVINYAKGGFIIVSADLRTMPVLAQSDKGGFDTKNIPGGVSLWVQFAKNQIKDIIKNNIPIHPIAEKEWKRYLSGELNIPNTKNSRTANTNCYEWYAYGQYQCQAPPRQVVSPLTSPKCEWGQGGLSTYYLSGDLGGGQVTTCTSCNKFNAGCGPVAMAQIARFYKKGSYDFDNMPHYSYQSCTPSSNAEHDLAHLMKYAGDYANSSYHFFGTCNTFTWGSDIAGGLAGLGFSNGGNLVSIDYTKMRYELSAGHPVIICGSSCYTCFSDYHIWVCDGYEYQEYNEFDCDTLSCKGWGYLAYYMNWGWSGSYNGLYGVNGFNPGGNSSFTANMYSLVDIRP